MKSFLEDFRTTKNPPMDEKEPEVEAVVENKSVTATEIQTKTVETVETAAEKQPKRKTIRVCKMGSDHRFANMNNHDLHLIFLI